MPRQASHREVGGNLPRLRRRTLQNNTFVNRPRTPTSGPYELYSGPYFRPAFDDTPPSRPRGASFTTPMRAL